MAYTTIHFVRHGEVHNPDHVLYERLPGFNLSERGVRMAQETGRYLAAHPQTTSIAAVYASPLDRTRQTAQAIIDQLNDARATRGQSDLVFTTDERLIEAGNEFRGKRIGRGEGALWRNGNWRLMLNLFKPTWGESYRHIDARMSDFAKDIVNRHPGEQVLAVSHESPIHAYRHRLETGHPEHNMLLRKVALASVTSITYDGEHECVISITYADPAATV